MRNEFKSLLFAKHVLVCENPSNQTATLMALEALFSIKVVKGAELLNENIIKFVSSELGEDVPDPFYRGFPESVLKLSAFELVADQLIHYISTYGFGCWDERGHSIFEETIERKAFNEDVELNEFTVVSEHNAYQLLEEIFDNLLSGSRPLNDEQKASVCSFIFEYNYFPKNIASKDTALTILYHTKDLDFTRFIQLPDVIKLVEMIGGNTKKLNLKNQQRKLITKVIRVLLRNNFDKNQSICDEKRADWVGLLHHIHFKAKTDIEKQFVNHLRSNEENMSVYSKMEKHMDNPHEAAAILREGKGVGAVARNLEYLLSRLDRLSPYSVVKVLNEMTGINGIILMQLLFKYSSAENYGSDIVPRVFRYIKDGKMVVYNEKEEEVLKRKTGRLDKTTKEIIVDWVMDEMKRRFQGLYNNVYIDPEMKSIAIPIQESTGASGYGVLPKSSRLSIPKGKKIRAFTYWEKVNDIDLSFIGIDEKGMSHEFSWRNMAAKQSRSVVYSGDETSGYHGGSEYFDVDIELFKEQYPEIKKLIFCDNVYSCSTFSSCYCKAGYMLRDTNDSGEVFEPKTVKTSFLVNPDSTFAYLFGIDLDTNEFVWLNMADSRNSHVAGNNDMTWLLPYFERTSIMNLADFFTIASANIVDDPKNANLIVSDKTFDLDRDIEQIHSYDIDKVLKVLNH